jgi:hypothetical protein
LQLSCEAPEQIDEVLVRGIIAWSGSYQRKESGFCFDNIIDLNISL